MNVRSSRPGPTALLLLLPVVCWAQADPQWLERWEQAWESRPAEPAPNGRIAGAEEPGTALVIQGQVIRPDGTPAGAVLVHAYHRDHEGFDFGANDRSTSTWRLQGWVRTDSGGRFEFRTIRPAPDALGREAAHIHFTLVSQDFGRQWAPKVFLADDPLVTAKQRRQSMKAGDFGGVRQVRTDGDVQYVTVAFRLKPDGDF